MQLLQGADIDLGAALGQGDAFLGIHHPRRDLPAVAGRCVDLDHLTVSNPHTSSEC